MATPPMLRLLPLLLLHAATTSAAWSPPSEIRRHRNHWNDVDNAANNVNVRRSPAAAQHRTPRTAATRWNERGEEGDDDGDDGDYSAASASSPRDPASSSSSHHPRSLRVGIVGAGSIAFGTASLAASLGHDPMIWSPSGEGTRELLISSSSSSSGNDGNNGDGEGEGEGEELRGTIRSTGALVHDFDVRVARCPRELVRRNANGECGALVLALPAYGHARAMRELAPEIAELVLERRRKQLQRRRQEQGREQDRGRRHEPRGEHHGADDRDPTCGEEITVLHVIISSHSSLGAVYLMQLLREELRRRRRRRRPSIDSVENEVEDDDDDDDIGVRITAWGTTAITARKTSGTSVNVLTVRESVDFCTVPSAMPRHDERGEAAILSEPTTTTSAQITPQSDDGHALCSALFGPRFRPRRGGLLAISLSNLNAQNHLGIVLGNVSRMDPPPPPPPPLLSEEVDGDASSTTSTTSTAEPWYQGKCVTPCVGRLMEALDRERLDIAAALGVEVRTIFEHYSWSFHVPMDTPVVVGGEGEGEDGGESSTPKTTRPLTISEMNQQMHHYLGNDVLGPSSPNSRYVLEDVPYGLVPTVAMGRLAGRPATLHEAGIRIVSAMYGRDFATENELLRGLGIVDECGAVAEDAPGLEEWREMAYSGRFGGDR